MEEGKRDTMENQPDMAGSLHTKRHTWILVVALVILILIIGGYMLYGGSKSPKTLTLIELKYRLEDEFGKAKLCGPPSVRLNDKGESLEDVELLKHFPTLEANAEEFSIVLKHTDIADDGSWTDQEKLTILRERDRLSAILLQPSNGKYKFLITSVSLDKNPPDNKRPRDFSTDGFITQSGSITITKQESWVSSGCPICLAENTLIDTPSGAISIQDLRKGMPVWTADVNGRRIIASIVKVGHTLVPTTHQVVYLILSDHREVYVSPGHPTIDNRTVGQLKTGDTYDDSTVVSAELVPYNQSATYDLLPSGPTGTYWANGIRLDSTLAK